MERRMIAAKELRLVRTEGKATTLAGYAAVFDVESVDLGGFRERIAPGAFTKALAGDGDIASLRNHDTTEVLGKTSSGTLRLVEDSIGLRFENDLPDTSYARDLSVSIERGDVSGMSFAFRAKADAWNKVAGTWLRTLLDLELLEISPVTFPAYPQTSVSARSMDVADAQAGLAQAIAADADREARRRRRLRILGLDSIE